ncbi:OmpA family protein [Aristophania vespae]|uniref:OmpA family protein n=1 Tax=Aristophania vespae TaxID=2697033 RepID=A0A6P1NIQ3_9PROT|nr:OmpA family protein [Aristophania vespae]QHI95542.1 OmpA family protein [Aristophania vespae]
MSRRFDIFRASYLKAAIPLMAIGLLAGCVSSTPRDSYVVFFERDSVTLSDAGQEVVRQAAKAAHNMHARHIYVLGSAGKMGDPDVLHELATTRALAVVEVLEIDGVDPKIISKDKFPLKDIDDSRLALRRVSIKIAK